MKLFFDRYDLAGLLVDRLGRDCSSYHRQRIDPRTAADNRTGVKNAAAAYFDIVAKDSGKLLKASSDISALVLNMYEGLV